MLMKEVCISIECCVVFLSAGMFSFASSVSVNILINLIRQRIILREKAKIMETCARQKEFLLLEKCLCPFIFPGDSPSSVVFRGWGEWSKLPLSVRKSF